MNFSKFAYLMNENADAHLADCVKNGMKAEKNARINPAYALGDARRALEQLFHHLSKVNNLSGHNLADRIERNFELLEKDSSLLQETVEQMWQLADLIRRKGNDAIHYNVKRGESMDAANKKNIESALGAVEALFSLLCYFCEKEESFQEELVPFGDYSILRRIEIPEALNMENYFVYSAKPHTRHYLLQSLSLEDGKELDSRREEAGDRVHQAKNRRSKLLIPDTEIFLDSKSDRKLVLYEAFDDSFLLSELPSPMTMAQSLEVGLELTEALLELKKLGMYHRNLYPGSVLIDRIGKDKYDAYLLNLQTSKVVGSDTTISHLLAASWDRSYYIPGFLRGVKSVDRNTDWEKLDVYALCRVILFCLNKELAITTSTAKFAEYPNVRMSRSLRRLYGGLFRDDLWLEDIPTLEEIKELLENERAFLEE